ncbi:MAG: hypothetical protein ABFD75_12150 [Smithella sp.]
MKSRVEYLSKKFNTWLESSRHNNDDHARINAETIFLREDVIAVRVIRDGAVTYLSKNKKIKSGE